MTKLAFLRLVRIGFVGLTLAACAPTAAAQETRPAVTQTIVATETEIASATPENTPTATVTATPENTPTVTATATPETTKINWPDNINFRYKIDKENLPFSDYGGEYVVNAVTVHIRTEDLHLNEPFTLLEGRFNVQGWADAWFMETDDTLHHITVPLVIFDTETFDVWTFAQPLETWQYLDINDQSEQAVQAKNIISEEFTGSFEENLYAMYWLDNSMCFTANGERDCLSKEPITINIAYIPDTNINTTKYKDGMQLYVEFFRDIVEEIYTKENVEAFWQTFDPSFLQLNETNLPENFIIPFRTSGV